MRQLSKDANPPSAPQPDTSKGSSRRFHRDVITQEKSRSHLKLEFVFPNTDILLIHEKHVTGFNIEIFDLRSISQ